jgi:hypothetical protein
MDSENWLLVAKKGRGKSSDIHRFLQNHPCKKQLVYDQTDNKVYHNVPVIDISLISRHKSNAFRVINTDDSAVLSQLNESAWNTVIILEDTARYADSILPDTLRRLLINSKQRGNTVMLVYHSFRQIPPKALSYMDNLWIGCTGEALREVSHLKSRFSAEVIAANELIEKTAGKAQRYTAVYYAKKIVAI